MTSKRGAPFASNQRFFFILTRSIDDPVFVKCEPSWPLDTVKEERPNFKQTNIPSTDSQVKIEEDPYAALIDLTFKEASIKMVKDLCSDEGNFEFMSGVIPLKQETKSELIEPRPSHESTFEPPADVKDEIFIEGHTVQQLVPSMKDENNLVNATVFTRVPIHSSDGSCNSSSQTNPLKHGLPTHTGGKQYHCTQCKSAYTRKDYLQTHQLTHSGQWPYRCDLCNSKFSRKNHLITHQLTHSGEKPYSCNICSRTFSQKSNLRTHLLTHTKDRLYLCEECKKSFSVERQLTTHLLIHSKIRPYCCNVCNRKFSRKSNLKSHMLTHSGSRPYSCNLCKRKFARKNCLIPHLLTHSGERPYCCNVCNNGFSKKCNLERHMLIHSTERL